MNTYTAMLPYIKGADYETHLWNALRGKPGHKEHLSNGINVATGAFTLTPKSQDKFLTALQKNGQGHSSRQMSQFPAQRAS